MFKVVVLKLIKWPIRANKDRHFGDFETISNPPGQQNPLFQSMLGWYWTFLLDFIWLNVTFEGFVIRLVSIGSSCNQKWKFPSCLYICTCACAFLKFKQPPHDYLCMLCNLFLAWFLWGMQPYVCMLNKSSRTFLCYKFWKNNYDVCLRYEKYC